jgi:hypothetical protein
MSLSLSTWIVVVVVIVVVLATLRWELTDFLLDRLGALTDWWRRGRGPEQDTT